MKRKILGFLEGIAISGHTHFSKNYTLKKDLPYILESDGNYFSPYIDAGATLTIEPGVILKTGHTYSALYVNGNLVAQGIVENPVIFTSFRDDTRGGDTNGNGLTALPQDQDKDWANIKFFAGSIGNFVNTVFSYGVFGYTASTAPISTSSPQLLVDFPTQSMWQNQPCSGINSNYIVPDHDGNFASIIFHTWTNRNGSTFLIYLKEANNSDFNWQTIETPALPFQAHNNIEFNIPLSSAFKIGKKYSVEISVIGASGMACDYAKNGGYTASGFYELAVSLLPPDNPALSIENGATVVIQ